MTNDEITVIPLPLIQGHKDKSILWSLQGTAFTVGQVLPFFDGLEVHIARLHLELVPAFHRIPVLDLVNILGAYRLFGEGVVVFDIVDVRGLYRTCEDQREVDEGRVVLNGSKIIVLSALETKGHITLFVHITKQGAIQVFLYT